MRVKIIKIKTEKKEYIVVGNTLIQVMNDFSKEFSEDIKSVEDLGEYDQLIVTGSVYEGIKHEISNGKAKDVVNEPENRITN